MFFFIYVVPNLTLFSNLKESLLNDPIFLYQNKMYETKSEFVILNLKTEKSFFFWVLFFYENFKVTRIDFKTCRGAPYFYPMCLKPVSLQSLVAPNCSIPYLLCAPESWSKSFF